MWRNCKANFESLVGFFLWLWNPFIFSTNTNRKSRVKLVHSWKGIDHFWAAVQWCRLDHPRSRKIRCNLTQTVMEWAAPFHLTKLYNFWSQRWWLSTAHCYKTQFWVKIQLTFIKKNCAKIEIFVCLWRNRIFSVKMNF